MKERDLRKLISESISEILSEGESLHIKGFQKDVELYDMLRITNFLTHKFWYDLFPKIKSDFSQEEIDGGHVNIGDVTLTPDGGHAFKETGIISWYVPNFPQHMVDKVLSYFKWILSEHDIKIGKVDKELFDKEEQEEMKSKGFDPKTPRVLRIHITENHSDDSGNPPVEFNLTSSSFSKIFKDVH